MWIYPKLMIQLRGISAFSEGAPDEAESQIPVGESYTRPSRAADLLALYSDGLMTQSFASFTNLLSLVRRLIENIDGLQPEQRFSYRGAKFQG